jgi:hypothetical protein
MKDPITRWRFVVIVALALMLDLRLAQSAGRAGLRGVLRRRDHRRRSALSTADMIEFFCNSGR